MNGHAQSFLCLIVLSLILCVNSVPHGFSDHKPDEVHKIELYDGVFVKIPNEVNSTDKVMSFEVGSSGKDEGRGKQKKLMEKMLPLFIMPFLIQSTLVPIFLSVLKFMLVKSMMIGKLALVLIMINAFRNHNSVRGRQDAEIANLHYGYQGHGMEEIGSMFN